jgi:hypothetical protein
MKTTIEIPDAIFRRAKSRAAESGKSLRAFVTLALVDKLNADEPKNDCGSWPRLPTLNREESQRIQDLIDDEFSTIGNEDWT